MRIIVSVGLPGSGKGIVSDAARSIGIRVVSMGDTVRRYHEHSGEGMAVGEFADSERSKYGKAVWAERVMEDVDDEIVLVDGCRSIDELDVLRTYGHVYIISVHTLSKNRYERLVSRAREDSPKSINEFDERDRREIRYGTSKLMEVADYVINNDGRPELSQVEAERILHSIIDEV